MFLCGLKPPRSFFNHKLISQTIVNLRSQFVTLKTNRGEFSKYLPFAFTELGIAMLSTVLNSEKAIQVNISIMRAFVLIRQFALSHSDLTAKLNELELRYDQKFSDIHQALNYLIQNDEKSISQKQREKIGFKRE